MRTITGDVWADSEVKSLANKAKERMYCVAYVTQCPAGMFRAGDVLVCDASRKAVASGETNPRFLAGLIKKGVRVYSCEALHAKCAVWDSVVLIGSANMSESSASRLVEISVLQDNQALADQVSFFIMHLVSDGLAEEVNDVALRTLARIWAAERKPWQVGLARRKALLPPRKAHKGQFCRFVTVRCRDNGVRGISDEEIATSEDNASVAARSSDVSMRSRTLDWYCTSEANLGSKLRTGDSLLVLRYPSSKATRAEVVGPCTVVCIDKRHGRYLVHYVRPEKSMPYRQFADHPDVRSVVNFRLGKNVDRKIDNQTFEACSRVLKRCAN